MRILFFAVSLVGLGAIANFPAFQGAPPVVSLTVDQQAQVAAGKLVYLIDNTGGEIKEGSIAFRINAPQSAIWKILSNFQEYKDWAYKVSEARTYPVQGQGELGVDFTASVVRQHYYVINNFPMQDWATWHMDLSKKNECVLDTVGYWRMMDVPGQSNVTDVVQYGKLRLSGTCANGFFGIGGFDGHDMAKQTFNNLKSRSEALFKSN